MRKKLTPSTEDYLETILLISRDLPVIRVKDISARMGVSMPSVNSAIKNLAGKGMVTFEKYGYIQLTVSGLAEGEKIFARHTALKVFFTEVLGLDSSLAEHDACLLEHYISQETISCLESFCEFFNSTSSVREAWHTHKKKAP